MNNILAIDTVSGCNYSCYFCEAEMRGNKLQYYTLEKFKEILDEAKKCDISYLVLTPLAGEVALDPTWMEKIEYTLQDFHITFFTNFSLFTPDIQDELFKITKVSNNVLTIKISDYGSGDMDVYKKQTGQTEMMWNKYRKNLEYLNSYGRNISNLRIEIHDRGENYEYSDITRVIPNFNIPGFCYMLFCPIILMNGDMFACQCGNPYEYDNLKLGNIYEDGFEACYFSPKRYKLLEMFRNKDYPPECQHCTHDAFDENINCVGWTFRTRYSTVNNFKTLMEIKKRHNL